MGLAEILDLLDKHGVHALLVATIIQLYMMGRELREHRKELKRHREDEQANRSELVRYGAAMQEIGTAVKVLLERDRDRFVQRAIEKEISGVHDAADSGNGTNGSSRDDETPVEVPRHKGPPTGYQILKRPGTKG
jgi:FtsZ-binding cell division protein ZapB